jgi:hypothetical protein
MRVGRIGRGVAVGLVVLACVVGCAASGNGARAEDDELPEFSAARLGEPGSGSLADDLEEPGSGSLADDALSPRERDAERRSWATEHPEVGPLDDPADDDPFGEKKIEDPAAPPKGAFARAMDTTGKFFVALGSVSVSLFMAVAPMLAMMGA